MPDRRALGLRLPLLLAVVVFGAWHWAQLEHPRPGFETLVLLAALAAAPALAWAVGRVPTVAAAVAQLLLAIAAIGVVTGFWPWQLHHPFYPRRVWHDLYSGVNQWFTATTPFDPLRFGSVDHVVRLGFVALVAVVAWGLLRGRPLLAVAAGFVLYALPSTVLIMGSAVPRAVLFLALTLLVLRSAADRSAYPGGGGFGQAAGLGGAIVIAALVVGGAPGVSKSAFFDWRHWNPLAGAGPPVSVAYVWNDTYGPLIWPKHTTTVLEVYSRQPSYWRAAVLNTFQLPAGRWIDTARPSGFGQSGAILGLPTQVLPPVDTASASPDLFTARFVIEGLAGRQLLTTGQPVLYSGLPTGAGAIALDDGTALSARDLARGTTYDVAVYSPNPTPAALEQATGAFPPTIGSSLVLAGRAMPLWNSGAPAVRSPLPASFTQAADRVWRLSGASSTHNEYLAVTLVEHYLRSRPFVYDQRPHYRSGVPVLVDFLDRSHHGYCQMFSASMALVLRLHGIPSRVAVGFTTGTPPSGPGKPYVVSDRDAHAWDEVYFPSYGWLPFDPTPTRSLPERASTSSSSWLTHLRNGTSGLTRLPTAVRRKFGDVASPGGSNSRKVKGEMGLTDANRGGPRGPIDDALGGAAPSGGSGSLGFLAWFGIAAAVVIAALVAGKRALVAWRYLGGGARRQAGAAFLELATFVADQDVPVAPGATVDDLAGDIERVFAVDAWPFARAAGRARYAQPERADRASVQMRVELRLLRRSLRRSLTRRERVTGAFRLRAAITHLGARD